MNTLTELAKRINQFDYYYEMREDHSKWAKALYENMAIKKRLSSMTVEDRIALKKLITRDDELINRYWSEYLGNLPSPSWEATKAKSEVFKNAWYYFKKCIYATFSESLKAAWKAYRVTKALKGGIINLTFRKATGEIRRATGTLNESLYQFNAKGVRGESKPDAIKYFDIEKDSWRCFRIERLMDVA